jgi:formylmethanofuran dehydrogenase subunit A
MILGWCPIRSKQMGLHAVRLGMAAINLLGLWQILMESIHSGNMYTLRQFVTWLLKMVHL